MLIIDKSFTGTGKLLINNFLQSFQNEFEKFVINYAEHSTNDYELEHIFWFSEQQVKTAVTCALNKPCNGHFMQEPSVSRKINTKKREENDYSNGRVDYWCRFGENTKLSILLEVKHHWINLYKNGHFTLYKMAKERHKKAIGQIKNIKKDDYNIDNLFGAALTILPIFTRYKSKNEEILQINNTSIEKLGEEVLGQANSNACGGFVIPKKLQVITSFYDEDADKERFQSFPGIIMLWSLHKFTRT